MNVKKLLYIPLHMETFRNSKAGAGTVVVESHIDCVQPTNDNAPCTYLHALNGKYQQNPVIYHENTEKRERHKNAFFRSIFVVVHDYCYCYCYVYDMLRSHHKQTKFKWNSYFGICPLSLFSICMLNKALALRVALFIYVMDAHITIEMGTQNFDGEKNNVK